jgi:hypothetical protein
VIRRRTREVMVPNSVNSQPCTESFFARDTPGSQAVRSRDGSTAVRMDSDLVGSRRRLRRRRLADAVREIDTPRAWRGSLQPPVSVRYSPRRMVVHRLIRSMARRLRLRRAMGRLSRVGVGELPTPEVIADLARAWGNDVYAAKGYFVDATCQLALVSAGPILECGTGLTTLLLAVLAGRRGVEVWSLEHISAWHRVVERAVRHVRTAHVVLAPLRSYGDFDWYAVPAMPKDFRAVVCDGPPAVTRGGRYGLQPVMGRHIAPGAVILLDDADRASERADIARWQEGGWVLKSHGQYAELTA